MILGCGRGLLVRPAEGAPACPPPPTQPLLHTLFSPVHCLTFPACLSFPLPPTPTLPVPLQEFHVVTLPSGQQVEAEALAGVDLALVHRRIKDIVRTLENFKQMRGEGRSRADYIEQASRCREWGEGGGGMRGRAGWRDCACLPALA